MSYLWVAMSLVLAQGRQTCGGCHEKERLLEAGTAHARGAGSCVDCHGGVTGEATKEKGHAGFGGRIDRKDVPKLCGTCHSDVRRMNPSGLPTDQLAQFVTSGHGLALQKGEGRAAVCSDCHGVHGIRGGRDPLSPVHPAKVPGTCGRCHSDPALMGPSKHPVDAAALHRESVHGKLLLERGDLSAPNCATCHGNHGAVPPGFADVGRVCGKCHPRQQELFESSPHAFYAKDGSFKGCVACHGHHAIVRQGSEILTRCGPCHEKGDRELTLGLELDAVLRDARAQFDRRAGRLAAFVREGAHVDDEQLLLERARTTLLQLAPLQHGLKLPEVKGASGAMAATLTEVDRLLDGKERSKRARRWMLVPVWIFLIGLAWMARLRLARIEGGRR